MEEAGHLQTSEEPQQCSPVGQLVFAKVKGFPAWPAKVLAVRPGNGCKYSVFFFGTQQTGNVKETHLWSNSESNAARFCTEKMNKRLDFAKGVHQMNQEENGCEHNSVPKMKEVRVMLPNSKAAISMWAEGSEGRASVSVKGGSDKIPVRVRAGAMGKRKPNKKKYGCEICSQRFSTPKTVAEHLTEDHLRDLRIDLQNTSLKQRNTKTSKSKVVARKKMAGGGRFEVWEANTTCCNDVGYSKGIKRVSIKRTLMETDVRDNFERRKRLSFADGDSEDEVTFSYMEDEEVDEEAIREMTEDTDEENEGTIDENSIEKSQKGGADVNTSGDVKMRKKILLQKLVAGRGPNCIMPECCNCEEVLEGKVYMCQVGHKFCKTCLRRKKVESVDLTLTCSAHCGMDIVGRDRGMEAYLQKLMV